MSGHAGWPRQSPYCAVGGWTPGAPRPPYLGSNLHDSTEGALGVTTLIEGSSPIVIPLLGVAKYRCVSWEVLAKRPDVIIGGGPLAVVERAGSELYSLSVLAGLVNETHLSVTLDVTTGILSGSHWRLVRRLQDSSSAIPAYMAGQGGHRSVQSWERFTVLADLLSWWQHGFRYERFHVPPKALVERRDSRTQRNAGDRSWPPATCVVGEWLLSLVGRYPGGAEEFDLFISGACSCASTDRVRSRRRVRRRPLPPPTFVLAVCGRGSTFVLPCAAWWCGPRVQVARG